MFPGKRDAAHAGGKSLGLTLTEGMRIRSAKEQFPDHPDTDTVGQSLHFEGAALQGCPAIRERPASIAVQAQADASLLSPAAHCDLCIAVRLYRNAGFGTIIRPVIASERCGQCGRFGKLQHARQA